MVKRTTGRLAAVAVTVVGAATAVLAIAAGPASADSPTVPGYAAPSVHSQQAYDPEGDFTSHWTRADAMQLKAMSNPAAPSRTNSMPQQYTMPNIPQDFPDMSNGKVWVWDTWPLTDSKGNQYSVGGYDVIFSLVADRSLGFDDRHTYAKIGYFYRPTDVPADQRPANGGWTYGGLVFPEGVTSKVFPDQSFTQQPQWSGSARILAGGKIDLFFTDMAFYRNSAGQDVKPADAVISLSQGAIHANPGKGVFFTGFGSVTPLLRPDGKLYQNGQQNPFYNFRDPFTFTDPKHPGKTFMVFESNVAQNRGAYQCTSADLGYRPGDPHAETPAAVTASGANYQTARIGLAEADNADLTKWHYLNPILDSACVTDQTERPEVYIKDGKYYVFTISHRTTFAAGVDGPEGVYGFVGDGIRSDFQPVNRGSGLALGNPTNLNFAAGHPFAPDPNQDPGEFQAYSHYVMPGGLVESFIDSIGTSDSFRRGGTLGPTVKLDISGDTTAVDDGYGHGGLGGYADIPANLAFTNKNAE
ncbi:glycoside hydrolase family 68 protein [Leifsonia sp. P73]|uniref:glycoside hydrolase family 68 protein n=1 Tax=Leifsonia sp. P73 TaxID=3423959 RepID=UPI003DA3C660